MAAFSHTFSVGVSYARLHGERRAALVNMGGEDLRGEGVNNTKRWKGISTPPPPSHLALVLL